MISSLPPAPVMDHIHSKQLRNWTIPAGQIYPIARQFGQIVYAPRHVGCWIYAYLYEASSQGLIGAWECEPVNGRVERIKQCAKNISQLCDWGRVIALTQATELSHEVTCALIAQVNELVRVAGGSPVLRCRQCAESMIAKFYGAV